VFLIHDTLSFQDELVQKAPCVFLSFKSIHDWPQLLQFQRIIIKTKMFRMTQCN
jgi:hypothetical protein